MKELDRRHEHCIGRAVFDRARVRLGQSILPLTWVFVGVTLVAKRVISPSRWCENSRFDIERAKVSDPVVYPADWAMLSETFE